MNIKIFLGSITLITAITSTSAGGCEVTNFIDINNYTMICYETPGSVTMWGGPGEPYVKFIMMNSVEDDVGRFFFRSIDYGGRYKEFIAINNTWATILGEGLSSFNKAIRVDLSKNKIKEVKGKAFVEMAQMKFLNLSDNMIESFYPDTFKMYSTTLQELDVSYNKLRKLSGELNEISKLRILHLQYNELTSISDDAFLYLKNLTYLNLQHNILSSIGSSLMSLKSLETLDISCNYLMTLSANEVNGLISIVSFNISHNELKSVDPNCFSEAEHLQALDFSFNNIALTVGENMFANNHELSYLNFYYNKIEGVNANAFKNCNLQYLNLEKNKFNSSEREVPTIKHNKTASVLSQPAFTETQTKTITDVVLPNQVINASEPEPTISNEEAITNLKTEIQTIHTELGDLTSMLVNLTLILENYNEQIDHIVDKP